MNTAITNELEQRVEKLTEQNAIMKHALTEISNYTCPDDAVEEGLAEDAGLDEHEFISMAYENVIVTAQSALNRLNK